MKNGLVDRCWRIITSESDIKTFERRNKKFLDLAVKFGREPKLKQLEEWEKTERFKNLLFDTVGGENKMPLDGLPTMGQLYKLEGNIKYHLRKAVKTPFGLEHWYSGEDRYANVPEARKFMRKMKDHTNQHKSILNKLSVTTNNMYILARASGEEIGALKQSSRWKKGMDWISRELPGMESQVIKDLNDMQVRYLQILDPKYKNVTYKGQKGIVAAEEYRNLGDTGKKENTLEYFLTKGEGEIFGLVGEYLSMGNADYQLLQQPKSIKTLSPTAQRAAGIADLWRNPTTGLGKEIQGVYVSSIKEYIGALKRVEKHGVDFRRYNEALKHAENLLKFFEKDVEKDGLLPILTFDVLPTLSESMPSLLFPKSGKNKTKEDSFNEGVDLLFNLTEILDTNLKTADNYWTGRGPEGKEMKARINYNLFPILDGYVKSAGEFQHMTRLTTTMIDAFNWGLNTKAENGPLNKSIDYFMKDLHKTYLAESGVSMRDNPMLAKWSGAATAYEYANKIGLAAVSVAKQAHQGMIGIGYMGKKGFSEWQDVKQNDSVLSDKMKNGATKAGITFMDVSEIAVNIDYVKVKDPTTGMYSYDLTPAWGEKVNKAIKTYASVSGSAFEYVENNFNRQFLFEIAYIETWNADKPNVNHILKPMFDSYQKRMGKDIGAMKKNKGLRDPDDLDKREFTEYELEFELYRRKRATNAGKDAVQFIHYDYHKAEKTPLFRGDHWLLGKVGPTIGQFTHYPQKHWTMTKKIYGNAVKDAVHGELGTSSQFTALRLSMYVMAVRGLFSFYGNNDVSNITENDTFSRINKWYKSLAHLYDPNDKKLANEVKSEWFGKGPVRAALGPFFDSLFTYAMYTGIADGIKKDPGFVAIFGDSFNSKWYNEKDSTTKILDVGNRSLGKYNEAWKNRDARFPTESFLKSVFGTWKNKQQMYDTKVRGANLGINPIVEQAQPKKNNSAVMEVLDMLVND
jgi:hypothetical protein